MKDRRIITLFITIFTDLLGFGIVVPILPNLTKELARSDGFFLGPDIAVGLVAGLFSLMQFLFSPFWGSLSDRIGRRPIILGSIVITAAGYLVLGLSHSLALLFIARIISGIGSANISAAQAYIADITSPEDRAKRMGLIGAAFGLGFVFGPPLGGLLYSSGGLALLGFFTAGLCVVNFIMAWYMLPESLTEKNGVRKKFYQTFKGLNIIWKKGVVGSLFIMSFIYIAAFSMMQINAAVLWKEQYHLKPHEIGNIFGFIGLCSAVVQGALIGKFQKKFGLRNMLLWGAPFIAVGLSIIPLPDRQWFYAVQGFAVVLLAVGNGFLMPAINAYVSINTPREDQGKVLGSLQSFGSLARVAGPVFSGVLYAVFYPLPYFAGGFLMLIVFFLAWQLSRQLREVNEIPAQEHGAADILEDEVIL